MNRFITSVFILVAVWASFSYFNVYGVRLTDAKSTSTRYYISHELIVYNTSTIGVHLVEDISAPRDLRHL